MTTSHGSEGEVWGVGAYRWGHHRHDRWLCMGGWTTSGTTTRMSDESVLAARAAICVAQFMKQPNPQEQLQALRESIPTGEVPSLRKGAGIKCPGKTRRVLLSPAHAPTGLKFF